MSREPSTYVLDFAHATLDDVALRTALSIARVEAEEGGDAGR